MRKGLGAAILVALFFLTAAASVKANGLIDVQVGPSFSTQITPGDAQVKIGSDLIHGANVEDLDILAVNVGLYVTGVVSLENLRVLYDGSLISAVIVNPVIGGGSNSFFLTQDPVIPEDHTDIIDVYADFFTGGAGTITTTILANGVQGFGKTSLDSYTGPANELFNPLLQVGAGNPTPEPGTLAMMFVAGLFIWAAILRRRQVA